MSDLHRLSSLIAARNRVATDISELIGRPAQIGHIGEFIASRIFGIKLENSATTKAIDGYFTTGSLTARSVNIKWYAKLEGLLDITPQQLPDFYLVLAGPRSAAGSSRGDARLWLIRSVHLFEAMPLVASLRERGIKIGVATSVIRSVWSDAEIYPHQNSGVLVLSSEQREQVRLFSGTNK
jgi:hypothetical protein